METPKSQLDAFGRELKNERTDRVSKALVEEAAAERREKIRLLRRARLERDGQGVAPDRGPDAGEN